MKIDLHNVPPSEAYVPSPHYVKPGNYGEEITDLMVSWLAEKAPMWADGVPIPDDVHECIRIARRIEAQILWLEAYGKWDARDHRNALAYLKDHLPVFYYEDACARIRATLRAWNEYEPESPVDEEPSR